MSRTDQSLVSYVLAVVGGIFAAANVARPAEAQDATQKYVFVENRGDCRLFQKKASAAEAPQLIAFLTGNKGHTLSCDFEALYRLRDLVFERDPKAETWIPIFERYLDLPVICKGCGFTFRDTGDPVRDALKRIGKPALPAMIKIVENPHSTQLSRLTAMDLIMGIQESLVESMRAPIGEHLRIVVDAVRKSKSPSAAADLRLYVTRRCRGDERALCEAELVRLTEP